MDLVIQIGESIWFYLDDLAEWSTWSGQERAGLLLATILVTTIVAYVVSAILYRWRLWIVGGTLAAVGITLWSSYIATRPEPTYAPTPKPGFQIAWWVWLAIGLFLAFVAIWKLLGPEGRRELRLSILNRIRSSSWAVRWLGQPTVWWQDVIEPPVKAEVEAGDEED